MTGIESRYRRFLAELGEEPGATWLRPPASAAQVSSAEERLGHDLPDELRELYQFHDGGRLIDVEPWVPCEHLERQRERLGEVMAEILAVTPRATDVVPGPRTLQISAIPQRGILYDLDERPGRLLYLDVWSQPAIVPLARDLPTLFDAYIALAEAGLVVVDHGLGPAIRGPSDQVRHVLVAHQVADVASAGISSWFQWPGAAHFSID